MDVKSFEVKSYLKVLIYSQPAFHMLREEV